MNETLSDFSLTLNKSSTSILIGEKANSFCISNIYYDIMVFNSLNHRKIHLN